VLLVGGVITAAVLLSRGSNAAPPVQQVAVPQVVGQTQTAAQQMLSDAKLQLGPVTQQDTTDRNQVGKVLESTPAPGAQVDEGSTVSLVVGRAPDTITVPPVVNLTVDQARTALRNAGFTSINTEQVDSTKDEGSVTAVDPAEGASVDPGTPITLSVSDGDAAIPDVRGKAQADAQKALRDAGFTNITVQNVEDDSVAAGQAVGTEPGANSQARADDEIVLKIAVPTPSETTTPPTTTPTSTTTASPTS
jgi:eukaryotic-like serine/threonine-protein kinase